MAANCGQTLPKQATGQVPRSRPAFARQASRACTRLLSVAWWSTLFSRYVAGLLLFTGTFGIDGAFAFFVTMYQLYMFFLMWRFQKRLEHYSGMKGPFYGGEYSRFHGHAPAYVFWCLMRAARLRRACNHMALDERCLHTSDAN